MVALRNFAAHENPSSKRKAIDAKTMTTTLTALASEVETRAPF